MPRSSYRFGVRSTRAGNKCGVKIAFGRASETFHTTDRQRTPVFPWFFAAWVICKVLLSALREQRVALKMSVPLKACVSGGVVCQASPGQYDLREILCMEVCVSETETDETGLLRWDLDVLNLFSYHHSMSIRFGGAAECNVFCVCVCAQFFFFFLIRIYSRADFFKGHCSPQADNLIFGVREY